MSCSHKHPLRQQRMPVVFDEFFEMDQQEDVSPFISQNSRRWGVNLYLKTSILSTILLLIAFILSWYPDLLPLSHLFLLFVFFLAGTPSLIEAVEDLTAFQINIDVLMTLAAFSSVLIGSGMEGGLLLVLFALSGAMEQTVETKAKGAISSLKKLSPSAAIMIDEEGRLLERAISDISVGAHILVKAGEVVPLDGVIYEGSSSVNLVHLTGENLPVSVKVDDEVAAGARNIDGALRVKVTHTSADSTLAKIIQLVTEAQEARPRLQRWFDRLSDRYAIGIILAALFFTFTLPLMAGIPFFGTEGSLYRSLAFLIAASPCALILAIPIAYLSAVSACAKRGVLLKGGVTLDALASCDTLAFDKTGTLTLGELSCLSMHPLGETVYTDQEALSVAKALEQNTVHPIATALVKYADEQQVKEARLIQFKSHPGKGLEGVANLRGVPVTVFIGRSSYIAEKVDSQTAEELHQAIPKAKEDGSLMAFMLLGNVIYLFRFMDTMRPNMAETIRLLRQSGHWKLLMLTGDHHASARFVAKTLGIDEFYADLHPEDKLAHVTRLSEKGNLAMIGDGVNDAPALARATVGICMGQVGSATAMEAADVVLLHDDLSLLGWLMKKARLTQQIVKENLTIATLAIFCASIPALLGWVPLWAAVIVHEGGTVLVGLNALRLLRK